MGKLLPMQGIKDPQQKQLPGPSADHASVAQASEGQENQQQSQAEQARTGSSIWRRASNYVYQALTVPKAFFPLAKLFANNGPATADELTEAFDYLFGHLYKHPVTQQFRGATRFLRNSSVLPNEQTTEDLIRFVVNQCVERSPVPVPEQVLEEFWGFYAELMEVPELKGVAEINLEILRFILKTYEPLLLEMINLLKQSRRINDEYISEIVDRAKVLRTDIAIVRRQVKALRHIKPFFQTDPKDFAKQAEIVADMVREFGPYFVKMAQVAASNADFLPEEIAKALEVFHEDVEPMSGKDVLQAFHQTYGKAPHEYYFGFNPDKPIKSGSIGSVYLGRRPRVEDGREVLQKVVVKISRKDLDREFIMGKMVIGLAIMTSQYWAPHSKLVPFLEALQGQVEEFTEGFLSEIDFRAEAANQQRFYRRSLNSNTWNVPKVYRVSERILEMEFLFDSMSLQAAMDSLQGKNKQVFQREVARKLLFTLLEHIFVHKEFHGDLHPGNVMVNRHGELHLIDWGNTVDLNGKWAPVRDYVVAALKGDVPMLSRALVAMSRDGKVSDAQMLNIEYTLGETLNKKRVLPMTRQNAVTIVKEGQPGLERRLRAISQMMSNTQQLGIVINGEFLHLSRSIVAAIGSYMTLYQGLPKNVLVKDLLAGIAMFPAELVRDRLAVRAQGKASQLALSEQAGYIEDGAREIA